eukprot:6411272-Amphidinium_carterae.1
MRGKIGTGAEMRLRAGWRCWVFREAACCSAWGCRERDEECDGGAFCAEPRRTGAGTVML